MENPSTLEAYNRIIQDCKTLFLKKNQDYGTSWTIMRPSSITDQIYIKAQRIRSIEEKGVKKISDSIEEEYIGIINYCIIALMVLQDIHSDRTQINHSYLEECYNKQVQETQELMLKKNHDYGEAWRNMRVSTITDMLLVRLLRIKEMEEKGGVTQVSEGIDSNYRDMINYAIFALILLNYKPQ